MKGIQEVLNCASVNQFVYFDCETDYMEVQNRRKQKCKTYKMFHLQKVILLLTTVEKNNIQVVAVSAEKTLNQHQREGRFRKWLHMI